ncbi:death-associated protein kinase related-like [Anthonomus grandis grandis]|uniref:death-associated protein kinase related-like n=1 Tax=Anthonomus grandis grandis TaxID=2921223 RepID=UPI00216654CB|nr:death-associated protein kinase related-like [Anthonomus grandis grandis]
MLQFKICDGLFELENKNLDCILQKKNVEDVYEINSKAQLGRGKYATVRRVVHKQNGTQYAAKVIKKRRRNKDQIKEIVHEIIVLLQCASTNRIIGLHEVYESVTEIILILELAAGGDLQHLLDSGQCLAEAEARKAMIQILEGVLYLHTRNIAHLDLKPQNVLLSEQESYEELKLCDFGTSRVIQPKVALREIVGTVDYVSPEVLSYEPISLATDIWSIGVLAYVILSGLSPFGADDKQQTFLNISKCALTFDSDSFYNVSSAAIDFIRSTLTIDPIKRPQLHELLDHPWISLKVSPLTVLPLQAISLKATKAHQRKSFCCLYESEGFQEKSKNNTLSISNYRCPLCSDLSQSTVFQSNVDKRILC